MNFSIRDPKKHKPVVPARDPRFGPDQGVPDLDYKRREEVKHRKEQKAIEAERAKRGRELLIYFVGGAWDGQAKTFYENELRDFVEVAVLHRDPSGLSYKGHAIDWDRIEAQRYRLEIIRFKKEGQISPRCFYEYVLDK